MLGFEKSFRDEVSTGGELGNFIDLQEAPRILQRRSYGTNELWLDFYANVFFCSVKYSSLLFIPILFVNLMMIW